MTARDHEKVAAMKRQKEDEALGELPSLDEEVLGFCRLSEAERAGKYKNRGHHAPRSLVVTLLLYLDRMLRHRPPGPDRRLSCHEAYHAAPSAYRAPPQPLLTPTRYPRVLVAQRKLRASTTRGACWATTNQLTQPTPRPLHGDDHHARVSHARAAPLPQSWRLRSLS
jgi:hypothetical protein